MSGQPAQGGGAPTSDAGSMEVYATPPPPVVVDLNVTKTSALQQSIENRMLSHKKLCIERPEILAHLDFKPISQDDIGDLIYVSENDQIFSERVIKRKTELQAAVLGLLSAKENDPSAYDSALAQYNAALASAAAEISLLKVAYTFKTYASFAVSFSEFCKNYSFDTSKFKNDPLTSLGYTFKDYTDITMLSPSGQYQYLMDNSADASILLQFLADLSFMCCFGAPSTVKTGGESFEFNSTFASDDKRINTIINVKQPTTIYKESLIDPGLSGIIRASRDLTASFQIGKVALGEGNEDEELKSLLLEYLPEEFFSSIDRPEPLRSLYSYFGGWDPYAQNLKDPLYFDPEKKILYYVSDFKNYENGIASNIFTSNEAVKVSSNTDEYITNIDIEYDASGQLSVPDGGLNVKSKEFLGINELINQAFSSNPINFDEYKNEIDPLAKNIKTFSTAYKKLFKLLDEKGNLRVVSSDIASDEHPSSPNAIYIQAQKIFAEKWHKNAVYGAGCMLDGTQGFLMNASSTATAAIWGAKVHQCFAAYYMAYDPDTCKEIVRKFIEDYFNGFLTLSGDASAETIDGETVTVRSNLIPGTNAGINLSQSRGSLYSYLTGLFEDGRQTRLSNTSVSSYTGPNSDSKTSYYGSFKLSRYLRNSIQYENVEGETAEEAAARVGDAVVSYIAVAADRELGGDEDYTTPAMDDTGDYIVFTPLPVWITPGVYNGSRNHNGFSGIQYGTDTASSIREVEEYTTAGTLLEQTYGITRGESVVRDPTEYSFFYDRLHSTTESTISSERGGGTGYYSEPNYEGLIELQHFYQFVSKDRSGQIVPLALIPIAGHIIDMVMSLLYDTLGQVLEINSNNSDQFPSPDIHSAPYQNQEFVASNTLQTNYSFGTMPAGFGSLLSSNKQYWVPTLEAIRKNCMREGDKTTWYSSTEMSALTDNIVDIFSKLADPLLNVLEIEKFGEMNTPLGPGTKWTSIPYNGWQPLTFWESRRSNSYWNGEIAYPSTPENSGGSLQDKIAYVGRAHSRFFKPKDGNNHTFLCRWLAESNDRSSRFNGPGSEETWATSAYYEEYVNTDTGWSTSMDYLLNTNGAIRLSSVSREDLNTAGAENSPYVNLTKQGSGISLSDVSSFLAKKSVGLLWSGENADGDGHAYNIVPWGDYVLWEGGSDFYINLWHYASSEYVSEFDSFCQTLLELADEDKKISIALDILDGYADKLSNYALKAVDGLTSEEGESALTTLLDNLSSTERGSWVLQNLTEEQLNLKTAALQSVQGDESNSYISKCDVISDQEVSAIRLMLNQGNNGRDGKNIIVTTIGLPAGLMSNLALPEDSGDYYQPTIDDVDISDLPYSPLLYLKAQPKILNFPNLLALPKTYRFDSEIFVLPGALDHINFDEMPDFDEVVRKARFTRYRYVVTDSASGVVNYDQSETFTFEEKFEDTDDQDAVFDIYSNALSSYLLEKYYEIIIGFAAAEYDFGTAGEGLQLPVEEYALDLAGALSSIYADLTTGDDAVGDETASQIFYSSETLTQLSYATLNPELSSITSLSNYSSVVDAFAINPETGELTSGASSLFNAFTNASSSNLFSASSMRDRIISANYFDRVFMICLDPDDIEIYGTQPMQDYHISKFGYTVHEEVETAYDNLLQHLHSLGQLTTYRGETGSDEASVGYQAEYGAVSIVNYPKDSDKDKGELTFSEVHFSVTKDPMRIQNESSLLIDDYSYSIKRS